MFEENTQQCLKDACEHSLFTFFLKNNWKECQTFVKQLIILLMLLNDNFKKVSVYF